MHFSRMALAALAALALTGCGGEVKEKEKAAAPQAPVAVTLVTAEVAEVPQEYEATGTVKARVTSVLSARGMGHVEEIRVQAGDQVAAGQTLAVLDARELDSARRQMEAARQEARDGLPEAASGIAAAAAQAELAEATFRRLSDLLQKKSISQQEYDEAAARRKLAQAQVEMARARRTQLEAKIRQSDEALATLAVQRSYTQVAAPFAGVVVARHIEAGMLAAPGAPLVTLEQAGAYRLEAAVEEQRLGTIRAGTAVTVVLDAVEKRVEARVSEVVPALDAQTRTFTARIDLPAGLGARSGLFGRALFRTGTRQAVLAPQSAIVRLGQVEQVFVAEEGVARTRLVTTGERRDGSLVVLSGLKGGERLVAPVPAGLADGRRIEARP